MEVDGFGLARIKEEGAPIHPEDLDWEHFPDEGCDKCTARWNKQLETYNEWQRKKQLKRKQ